MKPTLIIIGGYNSFWPAYLRMARDLEDVTGLRAVGVPLMPWHWWAARQSRNATNILTKLHETVVWAHRRHGAGRFVLVGHSAGGIIGRLYLCEQPVWGQVYAGVEDVAAIITLGSPHCVEQGSSTGWFLTDKANELAPGTPHKDSLTYRTVVGRYLRGSSTGNYRQRRAFRAYRFFSGQGDVWGDGVVPIASAGLSGIPSVVLEGVVHSRRLGRKWYGASKETISGWWPPEISDAT
jgi:pimeloyl-ACP methyl ester carboxylesterase